MKAKKTLAMLLALAMLAAVLTGCGGNNSPSSSKAASTGSTAESQPASEAETQNTNDGRKTKVSAVVISGDSLEPYSVRGAITQGFLIYEPLWTQNETNDEMLGVIAKEWTIDKNVIDVTIYDYVEDSEGNHITADDVVWSYQMFIDAGTNANAKYIESIEKTGDYSVRLTMTVEPWPTLLSTIRVPILSQACYEDPSTDFVSKPIGTGHYVVTEFVAANKAVFEKREHHWQSDVDESLVPYTYKANVDVVELDVILETPQIQNGLETGTLQVGAVTATIAQDMEANPDLTVTQLPGKYIHGIMLNCYQGVFKDNPDLRKAVLYAIDTQAIAEAVTKGTGHMAYSLGSENLSGYQKSFEDEDYYHQDLEKAKEYMAKAGYPDGGLTLKWLGKTEEAVQTTAVVIQAQLAEIGITLEISNLDNTTYMAQRPAYDGDWNLCWGDSVPKGSIMNSFQSYVDNDQYTEGNMEGLNDPQMQELYVKALYDPTDENVKAIHDYVKESASIIGNYIDYDFWGHDSKLDIVVGNDGEIAVNAFKLHDDYDVFAD